MFLTLEAAAGQPATQQFRSSRRIDVLSWGIAVAGVAAISLILLMLGSGLGFSLVSPWPHSGIGAVGFGMTTLPWAYFKDLFLGVLLPIIVLIGWLVY